MDIRKGDWIWFRNIIGGTHEEWYEAQVTRASYDPEFNNYDLEVMGVTGNEYVLEGVRSGNRGVVKNKRRSEAVRAAVANAAQEGAGQQRMFGGV